MTLKKNKFHERRVYLFICAQCKKTAQSYKRSRARHEKCRPCRKGINFNPNQLQLV